MYRNSKVDVPYQISYLGDKYDHSRNYITVYHDCGCMVDGSFIIIMSQTRTQPQAPPTDH